MMTMKKVPASIVAISFAMQTAVADATVRNPVPATAPVVRLVALDCHEIGLRKAAEVGGQLAKVSVRQSGGADVCVVVVLVPARDGKRPRRKEFVISR